MITLLRRIFGFFVSRGFWVLVLVIALSLFTWYAGPQFAFAQHRPLESESTRWRVIGLIFALYFLWILAAFWRRRYLSAWLLERVGRIKDSVEIQKAAGTKVHPDLLALQQCFAKAAETLKAMRVNGEVHNGFWSRKFIYELPWYVMLGAPGSGKTTALLNSGLDFPMAGQFGKTAAQSVAGSTRHCDWWFTDRAVLIDTAGRYVTQGRNEKNDPSEWQEFLSLLKKYRPRQPLNGVLLTLSLETLMKLSDEALATHLCALRERLNELQAACAIEIPVYLLVTKVDLIAGFNEFFGGYTPTQRDQVLGFTFPYSFTGTNAGIGGIGAGAFDQQWEALEKSLFGVQDRHLAKESDLRRRNLIYAFPQQFSGLRERLSKAVEFLFSETRLLHQPVLRGVYFCSGAQQAPEIDRVVAGARSPLPAGADTPLPSKSNGGLGYFLPNLLSQVIFGEAHLAGRNVLWERHSRRITYLGYGLSLVLLTAALSAWFVSYRNNNQYLDQVDAQTAHLSKALETYHHNRGDVLALLGLLDEASGMGDMPAFSLHAPPLDYRAGLYQGARVETAATSVYQRMLENGLQPLVAKRLEHLLRSPPVDHIEYLYEALKAYLMLQQPDHYSAEFLKQWVAADMKRFVLPDADPGTLKSIDTHLDALFGHGKLVRSSYPEDTALVADVRQKLSTLSTAHRAYQRLRSRLMNNELAEFNMIDAAGPQAANVFQRKSAQPLNRGVPGLFTHQGYWTLFDKSINTVVMEVGDDEGWVLGLPGHSVKTQLGDVMRGKLAREVRLLFLREYQQVWAQYLQDFQLIPSPSLTGSIQRLSVLSASDSPLPLFLRGVVRETTLLREPDRDQQTVVDKMASKIKNTRDDIERVIGPVDLARSSRETKDERIVDDYFEPLRRLVGPPGSKAQGGFPIDGVMKTLDEYYSTLMATESAMRSGSALPSSDAAIRLKSEASRLPAPLGQMLGNIASTSGQQTSHLLRTQMNANLNANVGDFCRKAVEGRYPLNKASSSDVTPQDFARLFGSNGLMDEFYNKHLAGLADTQLVLSGKQSGERSRSASDGNHGSFQKARTIKSVFFATGEALPRLKLDVRVLEMDASIVNMALDVDGTILRYAHGPQTSHTLVWPGPRGRQEVSLQIADKGGGQSALKTEGAWALHRFFDKLVITGGGKPETFTATALVNNKKVIFEVTTSSVQNPFRLGPLQTFSCPSQI